MIGAKKAPSASIREEGRRVFLQQDLKNVNEVVSNLQYVPGYPHQWLWGFLDPWRWSQNKIQIHLLLQPPVGRYAALGWGHWQSARLCALLRPFWCFQQRTPVCRFRVYYNWLHANQIMLTGHGWGFIYTSHSSWEMFRVHLEEVNDHPKMTLDED